MVRFKNVGMVDKDINRIVCAKSSKRNSEKGFTLVELIVVLVVMAVLAAAVVPALLGYTDHAKKKKYIETAKQCLDASQAVLSDRYNDPSITLTKEQRYSAASSADVDPTKTRFTVWTAKKLIDYDTLSMTSAVSDNLAAYTITYALFETTLNDDEDNDAKYVFYDGKDWEVYDTEDDVKSELSIHHLTKDNTSNVVFMWPRETDKIVVANHPEEWREESGEPIDKTVTFHLTHLGYEHGVVFKVDDEIVDKDEIQIKFTRNETSNPESGQCTSMMDGSVVTDEYGNEYKIALEDGFRDLKWSTTPGAKGTLMWTGDENAPDNNNLLGEIFNNNVSDFYATTEKNIIPKTAKFIAYNPATLTFNMSSSFDVTFYGYENQYDRKAMNHEGIKSLSNLLDLNSAVRTNVESGFRLSGWVYNIDDNTYEMIPFSTRPKIYDRMDEIELWNKVFSAPEDNPTFTGVMVSGKQLTLLADNDSFFGPSEDDDIKELKLESTVYELFDPIDNFSDYETNRINTKHGKRFVGWSLSADSDDVVLYNDNIISMKDYTLGYPGSELELYAVIRDASRAKIEGGTGDNTDYPAYHVMDLLANGKRASINSIDRVDYLSTTQQLGDLFSKYVTGEGDSVKGNVSVGSAKKSGEHFAIYECNTASVYRFAILWDGVDDKYPIPVFAYSTKQGDSYSIHWFSNEPNPEVQGSLYRLFNGFGACNFADSHLDNWDYSGCNNTSQMFRGCGELKNNDISFRAWDLSGVETIAKMFENCKNPQFTEIDFSGVDLASITSMSEWVNGCTYLDTICFDNVNSPLLTDISTYVNNKEKLKKFSGRNWNANSLTSLNTMFQNCSVLNEVDLSGAQFESVKTMRQAFAGAFSVNADDRLNKIDMSYVNLKNLEDGYEMFQGSGAEGTYTYIKSIDLHGADLSSLTNMEEFFQHQTILTYVNIATEPALKPTNCKKMFDQCHSLTTVVGLDEMNTVNVTDMTNMFYRCESMTEFDFTKFDYSSVERMEKMFMGSGFTEISFKGESMPALKTTNNAISNMFCGTDTVGVFFPSRLQSISFENCKMTSIDFKNISKMFADTNTNPDLSTFPYLETFNGKGWKMPYVTNVGGMFEGSKVKKVYFDNCEIGTLANASTTLFDMFKNSSMDEFNVEGWKVPYAISLKSMFDGSDVKKVSMKGCEFGTETENACDASNMFKNSTVEEITLDSCKMPNVTNVTSFVSGCNSLTTFKAPKWNIGRVTSFKQLFMGLGSLTTVDISNSVVRSLNNTTEMFKNCGNLTTVSMSIYHQDMTNNQLTMERMFENCTNLTSVDFGDYVRTTNIKTIQNIYNNCTSFGLESLRNSIRGWEFENNTNNSEWLFRAGNKKAGNGWNSLYNHSGGNIGSDLKSDTVITFTTDSGYEMEIGGKYPSAVGRETRLNLH